MKFSSERASTVMNGVGIMAEIGFSFVFGHGVKIKNQ